MKRLMIICIIILAWMYITSGRYVNVRNNVHERGFGSIIEEPFWVCGEISGHWDNIKRKMNRFLDESTLGRKVEPDAKDH